MDKGDLHLLQSGKQPGDKGTPGVIQRLGLNLHGIVPGSGDHVLPQLGHGFLQLGGGKLPKVAEGVQFQPQQQGFLGKQVHPGGVQTLESIQKIVEIGVEHPPLILAPGLAAVLAQVGQKLCVIARSAELDGVQLGRLVKLQKFPVCLDPGRI